MSKLKLTFILFFATVFYQTVNAQCAMCRAVLESEEGQQAAQGVNDGIVYLMAIPYILVAGLGFIIYWKFFRQKKTS